MSPHVTERVSVLARPRRLRMTRSNELEPNGPMLGSTTPAELQLELEQDLVEELLLARSSLGEALVLRGTSSSWTPGRFSSRLAWLLAPLPGFPTPSVPQSQVNSGDGL